MRNINVLLFSDASAWVVLLRKFGASEIAFRGFIGCVLNDFGVCDGSLVLE